MRTKERSVINQRAKADYRLPGYKWLLQVPVNKKRKKKTERERGGGYSQDKLAKAQLIAIQPTKVSQHRLSISV